MGCFSHVCRYCLNIFLFALSHIQFLFAINLFLYLLFPTASRVLNNVIKIINISLELNGIKHDST